MKLILTGATGFIGGEVLHQALTHPSIDSIITLSRRQLEISDPKLQNVLVDDFTNLSPEALQACAGADICIWTLGSVDANNFERSKRVNFDYTLAAAREFAQAAEKVNKPLRFLYTSGFMSVKDQKSSPWFLGEMRKMRGDVENQLLALAKGHPGAFEAQIARPAWVIKKDSSFLIEKAWSVLPHVRVDYLAIAMLDAALNRTGDEFLENAELVDAGRIAFKAFQ